MSMAMVKVVAFATIAGLSASDAIVCPTNSTLEHGNGAAKCIADKAGPKLRTKCKEYLSEHGQLSVTEVMHTSAGYMNPPISYVLHAVGPDRTKCSEDDEARELVKRTFIKVFEYANDIPDVHSISLPAISSGRPDRERVKAESSDGFCEKLIRKRLRSQALKTCACSATASPEIFF